MTPEQRPNTDIPYEAAPEWDDPTPLELEDDRWDAFLPDEGQVDPLPEPGDFWIDVDCRSTAFTSPRHYVFT